ncbi:MAG: hypothetical protein RRA63_05255 [Candidatus Calescibacterium sp.]|jgi:hypothetical protein|nr:hypothetical protein [Candidatus Calescibacterium sp.]
MPKTRRNKIKANLIEKNSSYRKKLSFLILILAILHLISCIEIHAKFKLNGDGSGYGRIDYIIAKGIYSAPDEEKLAINEDKLAEIVAKKEGFKVIRTGSAYENENMMRVWVEFEFKDISKLSDAFSKYTVEDLGNGKKEFRGYYRIRGELHQRELLKSMFRDLKSTIEVEFPGKVISTNGKILSSRKVLWIIPAEEYVGKDVDLVFVAQFEDSKKEGILDKIKRKIKSVF